MPVKFSLRVPSESRKGLAHTVSFEQDGRRRSWDCTCEDRIFNDHECKHIKGTRKFLTQVRASIRVVP